MGLGSSRPSSMSTPILRVAPVTREQLLRSSDNPRRMINTMFNTMISKITPVDILKLGNPMQCKDYVFAMAETLDSLFKGLKIQPRKDKASGVIVFQKVKELEKDTNESRRLCLQIAYFYIRIFQIFGALALTVVDDPGSSSVFEAIQQQRRGPKAIPGRGFQPAFVGGAIPEKLLDLIEESNFIDISNDTNNQPEIFKTIRWFRIYLINPIDEKFKFYYFTSNSEYNVLKEYENFYIRAKVTIYNKEIKSDLVDGKKKYSIFKIENYNMKPKSKEFNETLLNIINKDIKKTQKPGELDEWILSYKNLNGEDQWIVTTRVSRESYPFKNAIPKLFNDKNDKIIKIIDDYYKKDRDYYKERRQDQYYQYQGQKPSITVGAAGPLDIKYIMETLESFSSITTSSSQYKALNFCTARALQLLDATKIPTPTGIKITATSDICKTKLDVAPLSLPNPTAGTVPGIKALEQLYHTKMDVKDKSFIVDTPPTTDEEYAKFLQSITELFGKPTQKAVTKMSEIPAADAPRICASYVGKKLQISDPKTINETINIINRMFARQLMHTRNVIDFLRKYLLTFTPNKRTGEVEFNLNPRIIMLGLNEINQIGKMARQLLLNYYKDCETGYKQGIDVISKSSTLKPVA
jgi:hypothetical protein